jgi:tRNA-splicing ligase RtcB
MTAIVNYDVIQEDGGAPVRMWTRGVPVEEGAKRQLLNVSKLPFIFRHVVCLPDVHVGVGCTIGTVIATKGAIVPSSVGADIGCGIVACKTTLKAEDLLNDLAPIRAAIERAIPVGRTDNGGVEDRGSWGTVPDDINIAWMELEPKYKKIVEKHPKVNHRRAVNQVGTLGSSNHYVEVDLDQEGNVWFQLHSGSRGPGAAIGQYFVELAKEDMRKFFINVPDVNLAYLPEGTDHFEDYIDAMTWAQRYALVNRETMMSRMIKAVRGTKTVKPFDIVDSVINIHHNMAHREHYYGENVWVVRKGAIRVRKGDMAVIPGSMGTSTYIVCGKGSEESFNSASHGAGRKMSRTEARKTFTLKDHREATLGIECRKDASVIDETPGAYKNIDDVIKAQNDLIDVVQVIKPVLVVKG